VIFVFVGVGALGIWFVNSDLFNEPEDPNATARTASAKQVEKRPAKQRAVTTAAIDETPDLPALRLLAADGLTLAAEGIPEVNAADENNAAAISVLAAIETCRFAYAVWEFSPNKRFRFLTTCEALEGQVLVGAYEVQGSVIRMSPLTDGPATITSQLEVEKPSKMSTTVVFNSNGRTMSLMVNQRVTTMRGGLEGEAFQATYAPRNTLKVPGQRPSQPAPQGQQPQGGGLRDLLKPH
jgi:hypothetical protein